MADPSPPPWRPGEPFLDDYLQFLLATASGLASHPFHLQVQAAGVAVAEWRVLACLTDRDGQTITELARLAQMEQSRLTRVVERMEKRGYVTRVRQAEDRRKVHVWLAEPGRSIGLDLVHRARQQEAVFLAANLTAAEGARLKALLRKLIGNAGQGDVAAIRRA